VDAESFKKRTKVFALRVIRLVEALPRTRVSDVLGKQLLRSGTSVGANYRATARAKSRADFVSKIKIVEEECDESIYWMELIIESGQMAAGRVSDLMAEANEILAMTVASAKTARSRLLVDQSSIVNRQSSIVSRERQR
jgi:four helix bundle protein